MHEFSTPHIHNTHHEQGVFFALAGFSEPVCLGLWSCQQQGLQRQVSLCQLLFQGCSSASWPCEMQGVWSSSFVQGAGQLHWWVICWSERRRNAFGWSFGGCWVSVSVSSYEWRDYGGGTEEITRGSSTVHVASVQLWTVVLFAVKFWSEQCVCGFLQFWWIMLMIPFPTCSGGVVKLLLVSADEHLRASQEKIWIERWFSVGRQHHCPTSHPYLSPLLPPCYQHHHHHSYLNLIQVY